MKKGKIILSAAVVLAAFGSAFALKATKFATSNLYTHTTGVYRPILCSTNDQALGDCLITAPVYTRSQAGVYTQFNGAKYVAASSGAQ